MQMSTSTLVSSNYVLTACATTNDDIWSWKNDNSGFHCILSGPIRDLQDPVLQYSTEIESETIQRVDGNSIYLLT